MSPPFNINRFANRIFGIGIDSILLHKLYHFRKKKRKKKKRKNTRVTQHDAQSAKSKTEANRPITNRRGENRKPHKCDITIASSKLFFFTPNHIIKNQPKKGKEKKKTSIACPRRHHADVTCAPGFPTVFSHKKRSRQCNKSVSKTSDELAGAMLGARGSVSSSHHEDCEPEGERWKIKLKIKCRAGLSLEKCRH